VLKKGLEIYDYLRFYRFGKDKIRIFISHKYKCKWAKF